MTTFSPHARAYLGSGKRVLVYGAGAAVESLVLELQTAGCEVVRGTQPRPEAELSIISIDECAAIPAHYISAPTCTFYTEDRTTDWKRSKYFGNRRKKR